MESECPENCDEHGKFTNGVRLPDFLLHFCDNKLRGFVLSPLLLLLLKIMISFLLWICQNYLNLLPSESRQILRNTRSFNARKLRPPPSAVGIL